MRQKDCRHVYVWAQQGVMFAIRCPRCGYIRHSWETLDYEGDKARAAASKQAYADSRP